MAQQRVGAFAAGVGCTLASVVAVVAAFFALRACTSRALQGSYLGPKYWHNEHYLMALHYEHSAQSDAAVREWKAFEADGWNEIAAGPLAELLVKKGRYEEALQVLERDRSYLSAGAYNGLRANLLEQWKGVDAAVEWLRSLDDSTATFWPEQLGSFHLYAGRPNEALEPLLEAVRRACVLHGYRFDEQDRLVDVPHPPPSDASLEIRDKYNNDLADLWPSLEELATAYEALGDDTRAFQWATRDVSLHQLLNAFKGYYDAKEIECGSLDGRILRARVLLRRREVDAAATELDFASHMHESRTVETQRRLDQALAQVSEFRAKQK